MNFLYSNIAVSVHRMSDTVTLTGKWKNDIMKKNGEGVKKMKKNQILKIYGTDYKEMTKKLLEEAGLEQMRVFDSSTLINLHAKSLQTA